MRQLYLFFSIDFPCFMSFTVVKFHVFFLLVPFLLIKRKTHIFFLLLWSIVDVVRFLRRHVVCFHFSMWWRLFFFFLPTNFRFSCHGAIKRYENSIFIKQNRALCIKTAQPSSTSSHSRLSFLEAMVYTKKQHFEHFDVCMCVT